MFADTLLRAEQLHFLQIMLWGAANVVAGAGSVVIGRYRRGRSPLLLTFGVACLMFGAVELLGAWYRYHIAVLPDYSAAVRLDRQLWFELGTCVGGLALGISAAIIAWRLARRFEIVAAGAAVAMHAVAVAFIDLQLASIIKR